MSKAFTFNSVLTCTKYDKDLDVLCLAYGNCNHEEGLDFVFTDIEQSIKSRTIHPDCIAVIGPKEFIKQFRKVWKKKRVRASEIVTRGQRLNVQFVKSIYFYSWGGSKTKLKLEWTDVLSGATSSLPTNDLILHGLKTLIQKNHVAQIAPAGHVFKHPSGTKSKLFIQTRDFAIDQPELKFVAEVIAMAAGEELAHAKVVLIDTMGIYQFVAEALTTYAIGARIESFHGYDGIDKLSVPTESYFCIVSASTSGGMERRLISKGFDPKKILTLLDSSDLRSGKVLLSLEKVSSDYNAALSDTGETEIELVGENFTTKAKPPKPVILNVKHKPKVLPHILKHFATDGINGFNTLINGNRKPVSLKVDGRLINNQEFKDWINKEIEWTVPIAVDTILHSDNEESRAISEYIDTYLQSNGFKNKSLKLVSYLQDDLEVLKSSNGVLVVSSICGDGTLLRQISRDLREFTSHKIPRHFLVPLAIPQTNESWTRLKQFLVKNSSNKDYGISNWLCLPIGYENYSSWEKYGDIADKLDLIEIKSPVVLSTIVNAALAQAAAGIRSSYESFLPKHDGLNLELTEGFVYFEGKFDDRIGSIKNSVVYMTISSVIQSAREIDDHSIQLKPTGYESVVIAPETFLRFNDSILQASILRAAQPSELDYSSSAHLSRLMRELLEKVFDRNELPFGEAALEYALAIATGKLKIKKEDLISLIAKSILSCKDKSSALLGILLLIEKEML